MAGFFLKSSFLASLSSSAAPFKKRANTSGPNARERTAPPTAEVEEKLYKKFPEYRETNNSFVANGEPVLRFKTISQNNIGDGLPVTMLIP